MSYYDIDAILTDAQKVPCTFELTVPGLGYLEGNLAAPMAQGSKLELPLWLAEMLALSQSLNTQSLLTLDPPAALSPRVLNALKADPRTVDLRALAPHFYNLGARILELFDDDDMIDVLSDVRLSYSLLKPGLLLHNSTSPCLLLQRLLMPADVQIPRRRRRRPGAQPTWRPGRGCRVHEGPGRERAPA